MTKLVNFEDNIYIVLARIRMIRDLLALDADPELFLKKTVEDIEFIDHTLETLLTNLLNNKRLIERDGLLNHLTELEWQFGQILTDFLNEERLLSTEDSAAIKEKISIFRGKNHERQKKSERGGSQGDSAGEILEFRPQEPLVSLNELNELLKAL